MQIHHQITTRIQHLQMPKAHSLALTLLAVLLLVCASLFTENASAQSSQQERALMDYAKKYDQEQRDKRADEFERKLSGSSIGASGASLAWSNIFWFVVVVVVATVVCAIIYEFFRRNDPPRYIIKSEIDPSTGRDMTLIRAEERAARGRMGDISEIEASKLTTKELASKIGYPEPMTKHYLARIGWNTLDYSVKEMIELKEVAKKLVVTSGEYKDLTEADIYKKLKEAAEKKIHYPASQKKDYQKRHCTSMSACSTFTRPSASFLFKTPHKCH